MNTFGGLLVVFLLATLTAGCPKPAQFCCLDKYPIPYSDQTRPAATYCGDHSQAVNFYLATLSPKSAKVAWLDKFEGFYPQIEDCADPQCIAESVKVYFDAAGFESTYQTEHGFAETTLSDQTEVSLSAAEKADLIRCGFADAIDRASKNLKGE